MGPGTTGASTWWDWATAWRRASAGLRHGEVEEALAKFAGERGRAPSRIRRAAAAQAAAQALQQDGLITEASMLARLPLDDVEPLKRLHRFGADRVREPLRRVLHEGLTGQDLARLEREVRREAGATPRAGPTNQHAWRLTATAFREDVLRTISGAVRDAGGTMARPGQLADILAFPLDALVRKPDARFVGVRAIGARPGGDLRARHRECCFPPSRPRDSWTPSLCFFKTQRKRVAWRRSCCPCRSRASQ